MTKKVLVPLLEGFEEIEAVTIIDVLRRAGVEVIIAGDAAGPVRGAHGIEVKSETPLSDIQAKDLDMMVLPGGLPGAENLAKHPKVLSLLREMADSDKYTCAICAAPMALGAAGIHVGKTVTSYPGFDQYLDGANYVEDRVAIDGKLVTSRGPGTSLEFALALVEILRDQPTAEQLGQGMLLQAQA